MKRLSDTEYFHTIYDTWLTHLGLIKLNQWYYIYLSKIDILLIYRPVFRTIDQEIKPVMNVVFLQLL